MGRSSKFLFGRCSPWFFWLAMVCNGYETLSSWELIASGDVLGHPDLQKICLISHLVCLWTSDRRARHGIQNSKVACFTSLQGDDIVDDIMVQCVSAHETWNECFTRLHINIARPSQTDSLEAWWINVRTAFIGRDNVYLVIPVNRHLWKKN